MHLAHDEVLGRTVAIKRIGLLPGTTERDIERAEREARIAAGINHPHVVSILDLVKDVDCYWLVMEHVAGAHARGGRARRRALDADAGGRDPGPGRRRTRPGQPRRHRPPRRQAEQHHGQRRRPHEARGLRHRPRRQRLGAHGDREVTGSPAYLAPEVASGSPATAASDVWSLGATLYHAVVGRAPYDVGGNVMGGLYRIVHDEPPRLPADHPLAGVLARTMVKDPDGRWSAERVRDELRGIAAGATGPGRPPPGSADRARRRRGPGPPRAMPTWLSAAPLPSAGGPRAGTRRRAPPATRLASARSPLGWIAAAAVLVLLAGLGTWLLWPGDGERPESPTASSEQSEEP